MQIITVSFPKKTVITVANTAKHVVSADLTQILLDLDAINGEVIGTTAEDKTDKIEATKLAIEIAVEAEGVAIPALTVFADYPNYVALIPGVVEAAYKSSVDAVNGEVSADLSAGIALAASTKLAIETAIETAGVDVPALTVFADYPDYIADAVAKAINESIFDFKPSTKTLLPYCHNSYLGSTDVIIPSTIGGVAVEIIAPNAFSYGVLDKRGITSIYIPDSVNSIPASVFTQHPLSSIRMSQNPLITTIPVSAFNCGLGTASEIELSDYVSTVSQYAFAFLPLIKIKLGAGVSIFNDAGYPTFGAYGAAFETLYNGNGKLAGTYEYAAGTWSKTA